MKPRSKKAKGSRLERYIAKTLRDAGLDKQATRMPLSGAAYGLEADVKTSLPVKIEAKNQENWSPLEYYNQAKEHCSPFHIPMVVMSKNRLSEPLAMLGWNDMLTIMKYAVDGGWTPDLPFAKRKSI